MLQNAEARMNYVSSGSTTHGEHRCDDMITLGVASDFTRTVTGVASTAREEDLYLFFSYDRGLDMLQNAEARMNYVSSGSTKHGELSGDAMITLAGASDFTRTMSGILSTARDDNFYAFGLYSSDDAVLESVEGVANWNVSGSRSDGFVSGDTRVEFEGAYAGLVVASGSAIAKDGYDAVGDVLFTKESKALCHVAAAFITDANNFFDVLHSARASSGTVDMSVNERPSFRMVAGLRTDASFMAPKLLSPSGGVSAAANPHSCFKGNFRAWDYVNASSEVVMRDPGNKLKFNSMQFREDNSDFYLDLYSPPGPAACDSSAVATIVLGAGLIPSGAPTVHPSPSPSWHPTPRPFPQPTFLPTPSPTSYPTTTTHVKTMVTVVTSSTTTLSSLTLENAVNAMAGHLLGADSSAPGTLKNFEITVQPSRRLGVGDKETSGARELSSGVFAFEVWVDLAPLGYTNPQAWQADQQAALTSELAAINAAWVASCRCTFSAVTMQAEVNPNWPTLHPTPSPTGHPSFHPTPIPVPSQSPTLRPTTGDSPSASTSHGGKKGSGDETASTAVVFGAGAACALLLIAAIVAGVWRFKYRKEPPHDDDILLNPVFELSEVYAKHGGRFGNDL
jgi:hypothetical protein